MKIIKLIRNKIRWEKKKLWLRVKKLIFPKRQCNLCKYEFNGKFDPISSYYMENVKRTGNPYTMDDAETLNYKEYTCPVCFCSDRDRLFALYLDKQIDPNKRYDLLDIAPPRVLREYLNKKTNVKYKCADLFMDGVDDKVDIMDMYIYKDNQFDIFLCSHVLEHVIDDKKAMKELCRVLKPGGFGMALVPIVLPLKEIDEDVTITDPDERWRRFGQDDHVRLYSKQGYIDRLTESGFKVSQITVNDFSLKEFTLHGISPKSVLYIVIK